MKIVVTPQKVQKLLESLGRVTVSDKILAGTLSAEEATKLSGLFPRWRPGLSVKVGEFYQFDKKIWEVAQAHTTQSDCTPSTVPALFTQKAAAGIIPAWVQPTGAQDAYGKRDKVTHNNPNDNSNIWIYESAIAANTTIPGRDGAFDRYWTPVEVV